MTARTFLIRGLLAGLLAGLATFAIGYVVGEPQVDRAIAVEESHTEVANHAMHSHGGDVAVVSRRDQSTWGLATGTLTVGLAIGGVVALVAAGAMGRLGHLTPAASTATVAGIGYVSVVLVPFLKYPASPPGVGSADTIDQRTALYFGFLVVSLITAAAATALATKLLGSRGFQYALLTGVGSYLTVVSVAGILLPTVDQVGDFPGDVLWNFRIASLLTLTTLWTVTGTALTMLVHRVQLRETAHRERRALAASL
jgi:predicted cobalt transporter CbtA